MIGKTAFSCGVAPRFGNYDIQEQEIRELMPLNCSDTLYLGQQLKALDPDQPMSWDAAENKILQWAKPKKRKADLLAILKTTKAISNAFNMGSLERALAYAGLGKLWDKQVPEGSTRIRAALAIVMEMAKNPGQKEAIIRALLKANPGRLGLQPALENFQVTLPPDN